MNNFFQENKKALYGGMVATLFTGLGVFLIGQISGYEASLIIENPESLNYLYQI